MTIEDIANDAYARGAHPLQFAENMIWFFTERYTGLHHDDPAFTRMARVILGGLLDAGWTMPPAAGQR